PPYGLEVEYTGDSTELSWQPPGGIVGFLLDNALPLEALSDEENAEQRADPLALPPGPTRFHVYRTQAPDPLVLPSSATTAPPGTVSVPRPITSTPVDELTFVD